MSSFYVGIIIGFILGTFAGIILAAIMVGAGRESERIMTAASIGCPEPDFGPLPPLESPREKVRISWAAYSEGRYTCRRRIEGEDTEPNPYPWGSEPFKSWNRGWNDVMKERNDELEGVRPEGSGD